MPSLIKHTNKHLQLIQQQALGRDPHKLFRATPKWEPACELPLHHHRPVPQDLLRDGLQVEGAEQGRVLYLLDGRGVFAWGGRGVAAAALATGSPRSSTMGAPTPRRLPGAAARGGGDGGGGGGGGARRALALGLSSAGVGCVLDGTGGFIGFILCRLDNCKIQIGKTMYQK